MNTRILAIFIIGILLTGCAQKQQMHFASKDSDAQWRREMERVDKKVESISEYGGIKVFGDNPVKVVSETDYKVSSPYKYYYVVMRMQSEDGFFMDYVALKGFVENGVVKKEGVNRIDTLDFRFGTSRELYLVATNRATKDAVSRTFNVVPEDYEILDYVKIDDALFKDS